MSRTACLGILRRARERGKELPAQLKTALELQTGLAAPNGQKICFEAYHINQRDEGIPLGGVSGALMATSNMQMQTFVTDMPVAFAANQRDEVRDLHDVAGALQAQPGMKQQTFVAGFSAGAGHSAGGVAYSEMVSPTLKGSAGGNMMPAILCLSDQGGGARGGAEKASGEAEAFCISGNAIDRQPQNGGNGIGYQEDIAYTLTATDHHAVYSRQRVDVFRSDAVVCTQSARQCKDATDLFCQEAPGLFLIRRLTPLECERLQGFPDGWTDMPGASDSARYKALGNSVAIPCVEFIMRGLALVLGAAA